MIKPFKILENDAKTEFGISPVLLSVYGFVHTIRHRFCAAKKTMPDKASVPT